MVKDGEIISYINKVPHRRDEIATIFANIGDAYDTRKTMAPGVRQKKLVPLVFQLSKIIKEYEAKKVQLAANLVETQRKQKEAAAKMAVANVSFNLTKAENSALTKELSNLKRNFNSLSARLNKAIQNSRGTTRNVAAARRGGRRNATRKARRV
jgi:hypothetical protein